MGLLKFINNKMQSKEITFNNKSCKTYFLINDSKIYFTGNFDNGNLQKVEQISTHTYRITPRYDKRCLSTKKTFFHFRTLGFKQCTVQFQITRAYLLQHLIKPEQSSKRYHPVAKRTSQQYFSKITNQVKIYYNLYNEPQLSFNYSFYDQQWVQFAFTYPYTYQDSQNLIQALTQKYTHPQNTTIYLNHQILCKTSQARNIDLLTITDSKNCQQERQSLIPGLFCDDKPRPFKINKPVIVVSARVHPGEVPSSYCMEGILKFLLNQKDQRSAILRKNFHFVLIPMINPDGVYHGMFRNNINGQNLNRFYNHCSSDRHKQIWSIVRYVSSLPRVDFFFDLHAHPSEKGFFTYGNSFEDFSEQIQAQLFGKLVEYNCPYFQHFQSIFTERAMKSKDKFDTFSKQGCARVFYHKKFNIIHSYTVQCGYFSPKRILPPSKYITQTHPKEHQYTTEWQIYTMQEYKPQNYMLLGKCLLITILDLFQINPYPKQGLHSVNIMNDIRKSIGLKIYGDSDKFHKKDINNFNKINYLSTLISQNYYEPRFRIYGLHIKNILSYKKQKIFPNKSTILNLKQSANSLTKSLGLPIEQQSQSAQTEQNQIQKSLNQYKQTSIKSVESVISDSSQNSLKQDEINNTVHHQLLSSFSKYNKQFNPNSKMMKGTKLKKINIEGRKIKTLEKELTDIKKQTSSFFRNSKTKLHTSNIKTVENQIIQKLIKSKLENQHHSSKSKLVVFDKEGTVNREIHKKNQTKINLPSLKKIKSEIYSLKKLEK